MPTDVAGAVAGLSDRKFELAVTLGAGALGAVELVGGVLVDASTLPIVESAGAFVGAAVASSARAVSPSNAAAMVVSSIVFM